jgi:hypothetical protein
MFRLAISDPVFDYGQIRSYRFPPAWAVEKQGFEKFKLYETSESKARKYVGNEKYPPQPTVLETTDY